MKRLFLIRPKQGKYEQLTHERKRLGRAGVASAFFASLFSLTVVHASPASAACYHGQKWSSASGHQVVQSTSSVPSGWNAAIQNSGSSWNGKSKWSFTMSGWGTSGPPFQGGWVSVGVTPGGAVGFTTLSNGSAAGTIVWANTTLKSGLTFTTNGSQNGTSTWDVRNIVTHELGHWPSLDHNQGCGSAPYYGAVLDSPWWSNQVFYSPNADDIAGLASIYP